MFLLFFIIFILFFIFLFFYLFSKDENKDEFENSFFFDNSANLSNQTIVVNSFDDTKHEEITNNEKSFLIMVSVNLLF